MGLELTSLSHESRRAEGGFGQEADMLERLGTFMWAEAQRVLPGAATTCGLTTDPSMDDAIDS
jgi:hypothetical protein